MKIAVILTVLNEGASIAALLDSLAAQTRPPDEVVVADGGSRDNTLAVLHEYTRAGRLRLNVIEAPGANISQGRNAAIRAASAEVICVTDAGVRCEPDWVKELVNPLTPDPSLLPSAGKRGGEAGESEPHAVAGFFQSDPETIFEIAMGATVLPEVRDVNPQTYLPSSRSVAYRKSVWEAVGGYPEWLDFSEDVVFDLRVREKFGPFVFVPEALVRFRPRGSLRVFARQYFQYARGDGKANLFPRWHAIRYFTYWVVAPLLVYAALTVSPWLWLLGVVAGLAYLRRPLQRAWPKLKTLSPLDQLKVLIYIPLIRVVGDAAKMAGYPVGIAWRVRQRK